MDFIRAVHYFGRAQPANFWDAARLADAPGELRKIRNDGFNAVILVVPWRGFQRTLYPSTFDHVNLDKLRNILAIVEAEGLKCILRVSYPWNHDPESELTFDERIIGLFSSPRIREAWLAYLAQLRGIAEQFRSFLFAFFSWEDLPSIRPLMLYRSQAERLTLAKALGFQSFLSSRMNLSAASKLYGEKFADFSDAYIPLPDNAAYPQYNDFVNQTLSDVLALGRTVWPRLSMQVRADFEQIRAGGIPAYIENDVRVWDRTLRVTYYFVYMYAINSGEWLSSEQAIANLTQVLNRVTGEGRNTNHFLDQFVFYDNSPQFEYWARIDPVELPDFLQKAARLLKRMSRGYGLWNYRDYRHSHLYNPNFLRGLHGWQVDGEAFIKTSGPEEHWAVLSPGSAISQKLIPELAGNAPSLYTSVRFSARVNSGNSRERLFVRTNGVLECEVSIEADDLEISADLRPELHSGSRVVEVRIENGGAGNLAISDLYLWGFVFRSHIYDEHGRPGKHLPYVRMMNLNSS